MNRKQQLLLLFLAWVSVFIPSFASAASPHADFDYSPKPVLVGQEITFDHRGHTIDTDGDIDSLRWDFETTSNPRSTTVFDLTEPVTHIFMSPGEFDVTLTVIDETGNSDSKRKTIVVMGPNTPPVTALTCQADVQQMIVQCNAYGSLDAEGDTLSYEWLVDNQIYQGRTGPAAEFSFQQRRQYDIAVRVTDIHGDSAEDLVTVDLRLSENTQASGGGNSSGTTGGNNPNTSTNTPNTSTNTPNTSTNTPNTSTNTPNTSTNDPGALPIQSPLGDTLSINELLAKVLIFITQVGLPLIVLAIIYSGFLFVIARGNPEKLKTAKTTLKWTLLGAALILGARVLAEVIRSTINQL